MSCITCQTVCKSCSSNTTCDSCKPTLNLANASLTELFVYEYKTSKCVNRQGCSNGSYVFLNVTSTLYSCQPCTTVCNTCDLSASNCTSCTAPLLFFKLSTGGSCLSTCPNGFFSAGGSCMNCSSSCRTCANQSDTCTSCAMSLFLLGGKCVATCVKGTYASQASSKCEQCSSNCANCFGKYSCSECQAVSGTNYYLYNSLCITACPAGTVIVLK